MTDLSRVAIDGPLHRYAPGFAGELAGQGYAPLSVRGQLRLVAHLSRWMAALELDAAGLTDSVVERFLAERRAAGYAVHCSPRALVPLLAYLRGLDAAPPPAPVRAPVTSVEVLLERYRRYLTVERGMGAEAASGYVSKVRPFLARRAATGALELAGLTARDVSEFVLAECPGRSTATAKLIVTALRSLLGFLHVEGVLECSLTGAVPSVAGWRLAGLPRPLEAGELRRLLAGCDRRTSVGRRDFAILVLLARLALRRGEVARLELDDIDWRAGELVVSGKRDRRERLPLPVDVGEAIAGYLRRGRPAGAKGRRVFMRVLAPHGPLTAGGVGNVVAAAAGRAGLGPLGAHRLRHTAATELLRAGAPLPEIGQVLRHRRLQNTAIYAKVDRDALRSLARPWPGGAA
jgi:integrase/recombinase XerD